MGNKDKDPPVGERSCKKKVLAAPAHLSDCGQGPERHRVGTRRESPEGSGQVVHGVDQPAVYVDVEARRAGLKAAGVEHHVMVSAVR